MKLLRRNDEARWEKRLTFGQVEHLDTMIGQIRHPEVRTRFRNHARHMLNVIESRVEMSMLIERFAVLVNSYRTTGVVPTEIPEI
jgi:predicted ATP-dependent protease